MSSITSDALSTGSARTMRIAVTNVIQTKSGSRRIVSPGARSVRIVAMRLIAAADRADAEHEEREDPVVGPVAWSCTASRSAARS